jgi:hypothetical protein
MDECLQYGRQVSTSQSPINRVTPVVECAVGEENDSIPISNMNTLLSPHYRQQSGNSVNYKKGEQIYCWKSPTEGMVEVSYGKK